MLLETGHVDLHTRDQINDRNCLHKAAMSGRPHFVQSALHAGVDVKHVDAYGRIPLHYACMNGHIDLLDDLVKADPTTVNEKDLDNFTGLVHSIVNGRLCCVERLLAYEARIDPAADTDHIPLNLACQHGSLPIVKLLLQRKPQIMPDAEGLFPQHLIARFGRDPQLFTFLREYGADLDRPDKAYHWTPLFHAASEGRVECLQKLLQYDANPCATDEKGLPAMYYATWEGHLKCMGILASASATFQENERVPTNHRGIINASDRVSPSAKGNFEMIPDLSLPPPIIPTRRYGHNFLESKATVLIIFADYNRAVTFYDESKYPAARLTIAPRSSDIMARNILLPIQDENKSVSFEMDSLDNFAIDFDVSPTFGKKVIARASVPPEIFQMRSSSSGHCHISLFDPRLRPVGQMSFKFQVIKPFQAATLDITPFATYWKATSQIDSRPSSLVTGSSLSGDFVKIDVQLTHDGVPIVYPRWKFNHLGLEVPVIGLKSAQFAALSKSVVPADLDETLRKAIHNNDLRAVHRALASSHATLESVLKELPLEINIDIHVLYPSEEEEEFHRLGPTQNINDFVDALLHVVFDHAKEPREGPAGNSMRSIMFSSHNADLCTALNWKQPNCKFQFLLCPNFPLLLRSMFPAHDMRKSRFRGLMPSPNLTDPVFLCNELGAKDQSSISASSNNDGTINAAESSNIRSVKEAVRIAQANNLMGLVCCSWLFDVVPALIEAIKVAGLVLVADESSSRKQTGKDLTNFDGIGKSPSSNGRSARSTPNGIDGVLKHNSVLMFSESIEV